MQRAPLYLGIAAFVIAMGMFVVSTEMPAYMTSSPSTCTNCHVMDAAYENWYHSPHESFTRCVDCHLPHDNVFSYYYVKMASGLHDVVYFSTGQTPTAIREHPETKEILQENCVRCHTDTVESIMPHDSGRYCWDCHRDVSHGERGITLLPYPDAIIYPAEERNLE